MEGYKQESKYEFKSPEEEMLFECIVDLSLSSQYVSVLILAKEGLKPISEFGTPADDEGEIIKIRSVLHNMNFFVYEHEEAVASDEVDDHKFNFSQNEETLSKFVNFLESDLPLSEHFETSASFFGFPKTAVEGFVTERRMEYDDLPKEILESELGRFAAEVRIFILSQDHWKEELQFIQGWADVVKEKYPLIYKFIMTVSYSKEVEGIEHAATWDDEKRKLLIEKLVSLDLKEINADKIKEEIMKME